jgi:hypothetical protein
VEGEFLVAAATAFPDHLHGGFPAAYQTGRAAQGLALGYYFLQDAQMESRSFRGNL